ncbi:D-galactarate dehydratase [Pseudomonas oleovorans subsp. oleovorans]|jgi:galactarate dehydratase|uniref:Galactarate dehydratase n=2 Tax=Ectopseudomonas oleovorans TaxID=301 RepID=A0A061CVB6_ECTOL|nr:galactarate dehydratase [Pseudomonas sp. 1-7]OWK39646.1 D-galactarate dehydratase [Pseudomonas oleovorans subsp. oleovorans]CDM41691.1 galactarate dehydratase [Pseudomonas oleovorans CECT 5344]CDR92318.1 galactarate dehydratase [Pseudomonas oleovorans]SEJ87217.1 galactarate dehydratase [Pseudomonas oleovorans]
MTLEQMGWHIFQLYLDVASGHKQTCAERLRLHNDLVLFNSAPVT